MEKTAGLTRTELGTFARFCLRDPRRTVTSAAFYAGKAVDRLLRRLPPHYRYPLSLSGSDLEESSAAAGTRLSLRDTGAPSGPDTRDPDCDESSILLARGAAGLAEIERNWQVESDDWEQIQSLHRWNWLLTKLTASRSIGVRRWGFEKMRSWLKVHGRTRQHIAWNTYTVTERVANSLLFCLRAPTENGDRLVPVWLEAELATHAEWIANHLEFYGFGVVGNHILNDARGLYFYGRMFGEQRFERIATKLLSGHLACLLSGAGFLREGSSHYHFLIARWLLEILWLANATNDAQTIETLRPFVSTAVERCWFFLVYSAAAREWHLPLIGDVSPDFSPEWLMDLVWSEPAASCFFPDPIPPPSKCAGWAVLFPPFEGMRRQGITPRAGMTAFPGDGWYRLAHGPFTVMWHVEPNGAPTHPSHGHCDTGSFCLYVHGKPVLVDPGRSGYTTEDDGSRSAEAHNTLRFDGLDPFVYSHFYPTAYRFARVDVAWETDPTPKFAVSHDGFSRTGIQVRHRRTWRIREGAFEIEDEIDGQGAQGEHLLETFFQWAPGLEIIADGAVARCRQAGAALCSLERSGPDNCSTETVNSYYSSAYGRRAPAVRLVYQQTGKLPLRNRYVLRFPRAA